MFAASRTSLLFIILWFSSSSAAESHLYYAAIFKINIDASGQLVSFSPSQVINPCCGDKTPVDVKLPQIYIDAVRDLVVKKKYPPKLENGQPKEFFTWFFYVPSQPDRADLDPTNGSK